MMTPEAIARSWGMDPDASLKGHANSDLSAALWSVKGCDLEFTGAPDPDRHCIPMMTRGALRDIYRQDGRLLHDTVARRGAFQIVPRGTTPLSVLPKADGSLVQVYLPHRLVMEAAGVDRPDAVELANPSYRRDPAVETILNAFANELTEPGLASGMMMDGLAMQLSVVLVRGYSRLEGDRRLHRGGLAPWQLRRVAELMQDRIADDVRIDELAQAVGLSRFHFARAFKESTGLPPHRYQIGLRIERARMLLETTALPVADIAVRVGYAAPQAFAQVFRRETGLSPSDWRRRTSS
jgi:AraC family transcriptional regulator